MLREVNKFLVREDGRDLEIRPKVGEAFRLHYEYRGAYWGIRKVSGLCVSVTYGKGCSTRVVLVNVVNGVRVEFSFFLYGSNILKLERLGIYKFRKLRRGRLLFLRRQKLSYSKI